MGIPHHIQTTILVGLALHYCCLAFVNIYNEHCLLRARVFRGACRKKFDRSGWHKQKLIDSVAFRVTYSGRFTAQAVKQRLSHRLSSHA